MKLDKSILISLVVGLYAYIALPWSNYDKKFYHFWDPVRAALRYGERHPLFFVMGILLVLLLVPVFLQDKKKKGYISLIISLGGVAVTSYLVFKVTASEAFGFGSLVIFSVFFSVFAFSLSDISFIKGDRFLSWSIWVSIFVVTMFIVYPLIVILIKSITTNYGVLVPGQFIATLKGYFQLFRVLRHTFTLAGIVGVTSTLLGFIFALLANRSRVKWIGKVISVFSLLPIITPPFLIGLAIIYLFGVQGFVTKNLLHLHTKAIFGLNGLILAQTLSFAPISYMLIDGLIKSLDPSLEEASVTLGANRWKTFTQVVWPLLRIGVANSFLLTAIESMADFGNPIVLGGDYDVLATEIYFSIVGRYDETLASTLGIVLLISTLFIFLLQQYWIGKKSYVTVTGKPAGGRFVPLPKPFESTITTIMLLWFSFTAILYGTVIYGSFVKLWGINNKFTFAHYQRFFNEYTGTLWVTLKFAFISAFITAAIGIMISYLITRQKFPGRGYLEFSSLLSFAIPGTVIGIGYLLGFNRYPLMLTGTATIVILSFIFRYMPVGIRSGIAALSQLDPSLEEASTTLGGSNANTLFKVVFPLIKPAIVSGWVFGFVRSITAISAVIFLTTARTRVATVVILNRIEAGTLGIASAYSTILILIILAVILIMYSLVSKIGTRQEISL